MSQTATAAKSTTPRMGFSQDFIASFSQSFAEEAKARIGDNRREWTARQAGR